MGQILFSVQNTCCPVVQKIERVSFKFQKFVDDYQYFFEEFWFAQMKHVDPDKFIFFYQNYQRDQESMMKYWEKAEVGNFRGGAITRQGLTLSKKWLYLIRKQKNYWIIPLNFRGVPCKHARDIISDLFKLHYNDSEFQYKLALDIVFKNREAPKQFKNVPLFGLESEDLGLDSEQRIKALLNCQILNEEGINALIRLMWVIRQQNFKLECNPMLVHITALLLIFLTEAETFCVLQNKFMIEDSDKEAKNTTKKDLHWHLTLNSQEFELYLKMQNIERLALSFYETIAEKSKHFKQVFQKFKQLELNYIELFEEMTINLFFTFLPFQVLLKVFFMFLNEGVMIYYRMIYSLVVLMKDDILQTDNQKNLKQIIRNKSLNMSPQQADLFIKEAFRLKIATAKQNEKLRRQSSLLSKTTTNVSTQIIRCSQQQEFETIWEWLPDAYRLYDPYQVFNTLKDGYSLNYLYTTCEKYLHHPMLLIGQSDHDTIFGVFSDVMLQITSNEAQQFIGSEDTFVFILKPSAKKFASTGLNQDHFYGCPGYFSFGSGKQNKIRLQFKQLSEGPAFQIDSELNQCYTNHSETYNNYKLNFILDVKDSNEFRCLKLEIYCLR